MGNPSPAGDALWGIDQGAYDKMETCPGGHMEGTQWLEERGWKCSVRHKAQRWDCCTSPGHFCCFIAVGCSRRLPALGRGGLEGWLMHKAGLNLFGNVFWCFVKKFQGLQKSFRSNTVKICLLYGYVLRRENAEKWQCFNLVHKRLTSELCSFELDTGYMFSIVSKCWSKNPSSASFSSDVFKSQLDIFSLSSYLL